MDSKIRELGWEHLESTEMGVMASVTQDPRLIQIYQLPGNILFHGPDAWKPISFLLTTQDDDYKPPITQPWEESVTMAQRGSILGLPWTYTSRHR